MELTLDRKKLTTVGLLVLIAVALFLIFGNTPIQRKFPKKLTGTPCNDATTKDLVMIAKSDQGNYLADENCRTLYRFKNDKPLESTCYDTCVETWPPYYVGSKDPDLKSLSREPEKRLNIIKRKDGTYQYAYENTPLYFYAEDRNPGDTKGNGKNSLWFLVFTQRPGATK